MCMVDDIGIRGLTKKAAMPYRVGNERMGLLPDERTYRRNCDVKGKNAQRPAIADLVEQVLMQKGHELCSEA